MKKTILLAALALASISSQAVTVADSITPGAKFVRSPDVSCRAFLAQYHGSMHPMYGPAVMNGPGIAVGIRLNGASQYISGCLYTSGNNKGNIGWTYDASVSQGVNGKPAIAVSDEQRDERLQTEQDRREAEEAVAKAKRDEERRKASIKEEYLAQVHELNRAYPLVTGGGLAGLIIGQVVNGPRMQERDAKLDELNAKYAPYIDAATLDASRVPRDPRI